MKIDELNKNYNKIASVFAKSRANLHWPELDDFYQKIQKGQKNPEELKLLDIGCGSGRFYEYLQQKDFKGKYLGIDQSAGLVKEAKKKYQEVDFRAIDVLDIDKLDEDNFDVVVSLAMWHHLKKADQLIALKKTAEKMTAGSYFYLTVWNMWNRKRKKNWWNFFRDRLFLGKKKFLEKYGMEKKDLGNWKNTITIWKKENRTTLFYYAFTLKELRVLFKKAGFTMEKLEYSGGNRSTAQNIVLIAKKNN